MKKTYHGSCHCAAVAYEADIDLADGTYKCNCSICTKHRLWQAVVRLEEFRLLKGENELTDYTFGSRKGHHKFCRTCGTHVFGWYDGELPGGKNHGIRVLTLDDIDIGELVSAPVTFTNGRDDDWGHPPGETRHL